MAHPIFYVPQKQLLSLYRRYTKGDLNGIDSYLLYLALAYSTDSLLFACPAKYRERTTDKLVANTIDRLVTIIWQSDIIQHPSFKQPKYIINERNATSFLTGMPTWIEAWEHNIKLFKAGRIHQRYEKRLKQVEEKLSKVILSGTSGTHLALNVANWASIAGEFPEDKIDKWKETIRKCYNPEKMFNTPKKLLEEIKEYCEQNIEAGSIHFHSLMRVLRKGINNHNDYLGLGVRSPLASLAAGTNYTLLEGDMPAEDSALLEIISKAPTSQPIREEYPNKLAFIKAKLNYKVYLQYKKEEDKQEQVTATIKGVDINV